MTNRKSIHETRVMVNAIYRCLLNNFFYKVEDVFPYPFYLEGNKRYNRVGLLRLTDLESDTFNKINGYSAAKSSSVDLFFFKNNFVRIE